MALVTIITKNNGNAGIVPSPGNLVVGELAVNTTDRKLYTLDNFGNVVLLASGTDYDDPITIDVTSASPAVTIEQAGAGGGLLITNTGSGNSLVVEDSANPDSTPVVVTNAGDLIVGHNAGLVSGSFEVTGVDNASTRAHLLRFSADIESAALVFNKTRGASVGTMTAVQSGDLTGFLSFRGSDGTNFVTNAAIESYVSGTVASNAMPGSLAFLTTSTGSGIPTERFRITNTGALAVAGASNFGTAGAALISGGNAAPSWVDQFSSITFIFSAGGVTLPLGIAGSLTIPFDCQITEWTLLADQTGSIVVDIWKDTYANYPPTVADTITGSAKPTISTSNKAQSSTLTGWTTTINSGDILRFNIDSVSALTFVTLSLKVRRT